MATIKISGKTYNLIGQTPVAGKPGRVELKLRLPKGRRVYYAVRYENGAVSEAV